MIGGLLAFSSLRKHPDPLTGVLVTVLYCCFAYKNLGAIRDTTNQRLAVVESIRQSYPARPDALHDPRELRDRIEPTLVAPVYEGIRTFHIACDALTLAAVWAMEWRLWRCRGQAKVNPG